MAERKIFNYESNILVDETIEEYGYHPDKYGKTSNKFVIATCRYCGEKMPIRKGFFNRSGSACHKACRIEEQKKLSPFADPSVRDKAQKTIKEKYGEDRKEIGEKISKSKNTEKSKEKTRQTNLEKYGVENVFQAEEVKKKIKKTNIEKYGTEHATQSDAVKDKIKKTNNEKYGVDFPLQNEKIKEKTKQTNIERYGSSNPMGNKYIREKAKQTNIEKYGGDAPIISKEIKDKIQKTNLEKYGSASPFGNKEIIHDNSIKFSKSVLENKNNKFNMINILRENNIWKDMEEGILGLEEISKKYGIGYNALRSSLVSDEFIKKYRECYTILKSRTQRKIFDYVKRCSDLDVLFDTRKVISPLELDIYIPEKKLAIEYNGSYWHSEARLDSRLARNKHLEKTILCQEKGIRLLHIFEHNWIGNEEKYKRYIKNILGLNDKKIMARKCEVTDCDASSLIEENHLQGAGVRPIRYFTLKHNNEIVGTMTANRHHRQNSGNNSVVLGRLIFKPEYNISGGASKLFSAFRKWAKGEGYESIISWSDTTYSYGEIYEIMGFNLDKEYGPDYFYFDIKNQCYRSKQSQMKSVVGCPDGLTEREWCCERGLYRIWDCGKKKWVFNLR